MMTMRDSSAALCNKLLPILGVQPDGSDAWVSGPLDLNQNDRVFGGQLLAHAVAAASVHPSGRHLSSLRLNFLQGALGDTPVRWASTSLQQGSRFTTLHLRATQKDRVIADAQVTLQVPGTGFDHADAMPAGLPEPEDVQTLAELEEIILQVTGRPYNLQARTFLDMRLIDANRFLLRPSPVAALRYWVKVRDPLPDDPAVHSAALAYISDFWLNYASIAPHIAVTGARDRIYVASLNHALWSYLPCRADDWLLFDVTSPCGGDGRGLTWARIFTRDGRLVACASQEMVCSFRD